MSRAKRLERSAQQIDEAIQAINEYVKTVPAGNPHNMGRLIVLKLDVLNEKLDGLGERMELIETALGLLGAKNKE